MLPMERIDVYAKFEKGNTVCLCLRTDKKCNCEECIKTYVLRDRYDGTKEAFQQDQFIILFIIFQSCVKKTISRTKEKSPETQAYQGFSLGAARQTRTADLILTKDALYHLSHSSITGVHTERQLYYHIVSEFASTFLKFPKLF